MSQTSLKKIVQQYHYGLVTGTINYDELFTNASKVMKTKIVTETPETETTVTLWPHLNGGFIETQDKATGNFWNMDFNDNNLLHDRINDYLKH